MQFLRSALALLSRIQERRATKELPESSHVQTERSAGNFNTETQPVLTESSLIQAGTSDRTVVKSSPPQPQTIQSLPSPQSLSQSKQSVQQKPKRKRKPVKPGSQALKSSRARASVKASEAKQSGEIG